MQEVSNINPYLISGPNVLVKPATKPLSKQHEMSFGNMPNEGGFLLLSVTEVEQVIEDQEVPARFIRPFLGPQEFIRRTERRCVWITDDDLDEASKGVWLQDRFTAVRQQRAKSDHATTKALASTPHRFGEVRQTGTEKVIAVPRVSS